MKKSIVAIAIVLLSLAPALLAQGKPITPYVPDTDKIKVSGGTTYFAASPYLSISVRLAYRGNPVLHAKVRMNEVLLREGGDGFYAGSIPSPFLIALGQDQVITIEAPRLAPAPLPWAHFTGRAVLATYRVDNLLQWLSPTPGQVIDLAACPLGEIPCRWKFKGAPVKTRMSVRDTADRAEVFSRLTEDEDLTIPTAVLRPGKTYEIRIGTSNFSPGAGPMARFKLGKLAAPDSDVRYDWEYNFSFSTAPAPK
jgi:hypothetical protein